MKERINPLLLVKNASLFLGLLACGASEYVYAAHDVGEITH